MAKENKLTIWQKIGMFFYSKRAFTMFIWISVVIVGIMSYTSWMRREGFPSINVPIGIVRIVSFDNSAEIVDEKFVLPVVQELKNNSTVKDVSSTASDQGATVVVNFNSGTDVQVQLDSVKSKMDGKLPSGAQLVYLKVNAGKLTNEGDDILIAVHGKGLSADKLDALASSVVPIFKENVSLAENVRSIPLVEVANNAVTGLPSSAQVRFDRFYDESTDGFEPSGIVAIRGVNGVDQLKLYDQVQSAIDSGAFDNIGANVSISADFAESIREQISGLQRNLFEGLVVVLIVSFILISLRGSIITALAMTTTVIATVGIIFLLGFTLNTITLFSLVLCLALIVDDTTIIVESIDAGLKKGGRFRDVVRDSFKKVARASATGTAVTMLAFAPMLFIGGILGQFIRAIPITIIISLAVSLVVSFMFIPLMMRLSYGKLKNGKVDSKLRFTDKMEAKLGTNLANAIVWSAETKKRRFLMRSGAVFMSLAFVAIGGFVFTKVEFNIFPSPKDGNDLVIKGTVIDRVNATVAGTEKMTDESLSIVGDAIGDNLGRLTLSGQGAVADRDGFTASVTLIGYDKRDKTSVEITDELNAKLANAVPGMRVSAEASGVGPPAGGFEVAIASDNTEGSNKLANDIKIFLENEELKRINGTTTKLANVRVTPTNLVVRDGQKRVVSVIADFVDKDTSTLVTIAQNAVEKEFSADRVKSEYGLPSDSISFNFGQEEENQDSFSSMGTAAGPLFLVMFVLMAILFGSIAQPVLIFTALPFAFLGVAVGLYVTDNPISFFSMLGVFALIGISLNNTILLTDYANRARKEGEKPVDAIAGAVRERLRPLLTTSITSVFALLPLALNDPFWEGLAFALIFGLISSTILVILVFPYFYLIEESISSYVGRLFRRVVKTKRA